MSLKLVEILVLGQVLRLNVPIEQEELLRQAARNLDKTAKIEEVLRTGIQQLDHSLENIRVTKEPH